MVTWENYEEYMMMHADGELQPHEEAELQFFLEEHPQLKAEMAMYERTILTPDMSQVYEHKTSLLKEEPAGKRIAFIPNRRAYGIAAGIAALVVLGFFALQNRNTAAPGGVVRNDSGKLLPVSHANATVPAPINTPSADNVATIDHANDNTTAAPATRAAHPVTPQHLQEQHTVAQHKEQVKHEQTVPQQYHTTEPMTPIAANEIKKQPLSNAVNEKLQPVTLPEYAMTDNKTQKTSWIDRLPITDEKKEQLNNVANTLTDGVAKASSLKESIADKSVSVRVEKRRLILSF